MKGRGAFILVALTFVALVILVVGAAWLFKPNQAPKLTLTPTQAPSPVSTGTSSPTATYSNGLTPEPHEKVVDGFRIIGEEQDVTLKPGTTITATAPETIHVQAKLSTNYAEQEEDLVFSWFTCRTGSSPIQQEDGTSGLFYAVPSKPGPDCICVAVEKGDVLLDREIIFLDLQK